MLYHILKGIQPTVTGPDGDESILHPILDDGSRRYRRSSLKKTLRLIATALGLSEDDLKLFN